MKDYLRPVMMAFLGFSLWTVSDAIIRYLNDYPTVLVTFLCSLSAVTFTVLFSPFIGGFRKTFSDPKLGLRIVRGLCLACAGFLSFVAFSNLELPTAYAFVFAAPFVAKILSVFVTRENIRLRSWAITALGFFGVLIVLRPGMVPISIGSLSALGLAFLFGAGYVLSRYIGAENQTLLSMGLFQYVFMLLGTAYPAYLAYESMPDGAFFSPFELFLAALTGFTGIIGSITVAYGFTNGPSALIAPIHYVQILWGALWGIVLFGEYPDLWTITGGAVIICAGLLLIRFSRPV